MRTSHHRPAVAALVAVLAVSATAAGRVLTTRTVEQRLARLGELADENHWGKVETEAQQLIDDLE